MININPNRINVSSGTSGKTTERRNQEADAQPEVIVPKRAHVNYIPSSESLQTLIRGAVEALRRGTRWDRGTILNLLV